jgi:hypothetical protein
MKVRARHPISTGTGANKVVIPKFTEGTLVAVTERMKESFPNLKENSTSSYYLVKFDNIPELLVDRSQVEII